MKILDRLEKRFGRWAVPHVSVHIVLAQLVIFVLGAGGDYEDLLRFLYLIPDKVLDFEVWRLFTYVLVPTVGNLIFFLIWCYLFWMMGSALEAVWGAFRFNVFLLVGWAATAAVAFTLPLPGAEDILLDEDLADAWAHLNLYYLTSVFLAFAVINPNFELYVFFVLPVKVKWLALIAWLGYLHTLLVGPNPERLLVMAAILNWLLFFGPGLVTGAKAYRRRTAFHAQRQADAAEPFHTCMVCGKTDQTDPDMTFRYCPGCAGSCGYCEEHIDNHEHVTAADRAAAEEAAAEEAAAEDTRKARG